VVDAKASGLIWTALSWSAVALQQAERARADWAVAAPMSEVDAVKAG
jgi:hypothetical protein